MRLPYYLTHPRQAWNRPSPVQLRWGRRVFLWLILWYVIRYTYYGKFVKTDSYAAQWLALALWSQTLVIYHLFAYVVFPRTIYKGRVIVAILGLYLAHTLVYWQNYALLEWLVETKRQPGLNQVWRLLNQWGWWGFTTSLAAVFWNIFWSFAIASMLLIVRAINDLIEIRTRAAQLEKEKLAVELDFLKSQINPHFLFNTLNNVYARVFDTDEQAADLLLRLSELMRYNLYETDQPLIDLTKELAYIQNYLDLERNRLLGRPIDILYQQTGSAEGHQIAPLLLIAFVENAFKHGVKGTSQAAFVRVYVEVEESRLVFTVRNSLLPSRQVANDPVQKSGGFGLANVRHRLRSLYPDKHSIIVRRSTEYEYSVTITLWL